MTNQCWPYSHRHPHPHPRVRKRGRLKGFGRWDQRLDLWIACGPTPIIRFTILLLLLTQTILDFLFFFKGFLCSMFYQLLLSISLHKRKTSIIYHSFFFFVNNLFLFYIYIGFSSIFFFRYFSHFLGLEGILLIFRCRGIRSFFRFWGYFSHFLDLGVFWSIFKFKGYFGYF